MNKTYSMSIRVSEEELNRLKQAAKLESYSSYSEFVRRIALKEADKVIKKEKKINRTLVRAGKMSYTNMEQDDIWRCWYG